MTRRDTLAARFAVPTLLEALSKKITDAEGSLVLCVLACVHVYLCVRACMLLGVPLCVFWGGGGGGGAKGIIFFYFLL